MHNCLLRVLKSSFNLDIYPIDKRSLLNHQLIQLLINSGKLAYRLQQLPYLHIAFIRELRLNILLSNVLFLHYFALLGCQLDCGIACLTFILSDCIEVFLLLLTKWARCFSNRASHWLLQMQKNYTKRNAYIFVRNHFMAQSSSIFLIIAHIRQDPILHIAYISCGMSEISNFLIVFFVLFLFEWDEPRFGQGGHIFFWMRMNDYVAMRL